MIIDVILVSKNENKEQVKSNVITQLAMDEARKIMNGEVEAKSYESIKEILDEIDIEN